MWTGQDVGNLGIELLDLLDCRFIMVLHVKVEIYKTERRRIFAVFATESGAIV